jgi:hypothetical protein
VLGVHRNTVGPWFDALQERGFIRMNRAPCLGPSGVGQTAHWALEELPTDDMKSAPKAFMAWRQKQKPRTENRTARHKKPATNAAIQTATRPTVLKIVTAAGENR